MRLAVIGCGHVGLVSAATFAELGHEVAGMDSDAGRVEQLRRGEAPFHEPGLDPLLRTHTGGRLRFTGDAAEALDGAAAAFISVNTPLRPDGRLSLVAVEHVSRLVTAAAAAGTVLVEKSTVPVETAQRIRSVVQEAGRSDELIVASNPEFLREGSAVHDALHPDRIVVGLDDARRGEDVMRAVYEPLLDRHACPLILTDLATAEMIKHASNGFLATKISYVNAVAELCEKVGADIGVVSEAMGMDQRIGSAFLQAGVGYGGSCFPKDTAEFVAHARELHLPFTLLEEVRRINERQRERFVEKVRRAVWNLEGKTIAVWGMSFKAGTDDVRESPALTIVPKLVAEGATVRVYDPVARPDLPDVAFAPSALDAARDADALAILTDWPEFAEVDLDTLRGVLRRPVVIDGRNLFAPARMAAAGFTYLSYGRPDVTAAP